MQVALLRERGPEPGRHSRTPADVIERAATRMNRLIQDLLDVTRMEERHLSIEQVQVPAEQIIFDSVEAQSGLAASESIELRLDVAPSLGEVWADRDRVLQLFENLIGNALKLQRPIAPAS